MVEKVCFFTRESEGVRVKNEEKARGYPIHKRFVPQRFGNEKIRTKKIRTKKIREQGDSGPKSLKNENSQKQFWPNT